MHPIAFPITATACCLAQVHVDWLGHGLGPTTTHNVSLTLHRVSFVSLRPSAPSPSSTPSPPPPSLPSLSSLSSLSLFPSLRECKVFGVNFRTPPSDDTGVAHILEHSVLCGSRKYPVKEPFVELLKGSMQTFLNAFTYPDRTCYPVASQVSMKV